jgi:hypothetical protein
VTGQNTAAAERSAHVRRDPSPGHDTGAIVEIAPGTVRLRCAIERDAALAQLAALPPTPSLRGGSAGITNGLVVVEIKPSATAAHLRDMAAELTKMAEERA